MRWSYDYEYVVMIIVKLVSCLYFGVDYGSSYDVCYLLVD
jgi:hypothetical protein